MSLVKDIYKKAVEIDSKVCDKFTGKENYNEIVELLLSIQGIEFCTKYSFPKLDYFEGFLKDNNPCKKGIYINAGVIETENEEIVLLVGNTNAVLKYNNTDVGYKVILMHGARAEIIADNYAVVFLYGEKDNINVECKNNAIVKC